MYKIIGGDGKQYGPIDGDQLRSWIAQGRANAQTLVQAANVPDWRPLGSYAEFAVALGQPTPPVGAAGDAVPPAVTGRDAALEAVKSPAIALKITAILGLVFVAVGLVLNFLALLGVQFHSQSFHGSEQIFTALSGGFGIVQNLLKIAMGVLILIGAGKLERLESYPFALTASILAMVPCASPCCWIGLPVGIWALTVINRSDVKSHFT
jgi:hypothetical protein